VVDEVSVVLVSATLGAVADAIGALFAGIVGTGCEAT
jgi:hypothetical protein